MRTLMLLAIAACLPVAQAAVVYQCDFEDGQMPGWSVAEGREERTALAVVGAEDGAPEMAEGRRCLRMRGIAIWNLCDLMLEQPVTLDGPIYLIADWRSHGPVGQMTAMLHVEGEARPVYSTTGPVGRLAVDRWDKLVARLDQFDPAMAGKALRGVRWAVRCTVGAEMGDGVAPEHDTYLDNVRIVTGADIAQAEAIAEHEAAPREYCGPERFAIEDAEQFAVWHTPSLAPAMRNTPVPAVQARPARVRLARREAESFEIVATVRTLDEVTVKLLPSALSGPEGAELPADSIEVHPVRTVPLITRLGFPLPMRWPDPLSRDESTTLTGPAHIPFWVTVHAPADVAPGSYTVSMTLQITGGITAAVSVPLRVEVLDFELPLRPSYRTNQQLWGVKRGEARPWIEALAGCRMYDANLWYSDPDEQRWRMEELGQNAIKITMTGGHGNKPVQFDGHDIYTDEYEAAFKERLHKLVQPIVDNGWEQDAFIYIWDENWGAAEVFDHVAYLVGLIREEGVKIPVLAALPVHEKVEGLVNIYLAEYSPQETIRRRLAEGDEFWRWGNVDMELGKAPLAVRMCYGFESVARNFTGAYSWGVSAWREADPWVDYDRANWGGTIFYPGAHEGSTPDLPVTSIRMELLRDGIEDYEYVAILRALIDQRAQVAPEQVAQARALIAEAEDLAAIPSDFRRCDEGVDEMLALRARMQDAILALQQ